MVRSSLRQEGTARSLPNHRNRPLLDGGRYRRSPSTRLHYQSGCSVPLCPHTCVLPFRPIGPGHSTRRPKRPSLRSSRLTPAARSTEDRTSRSTSLGLLAYVPRLDRPRMGCISDENGRARRPVYWADRGGTYTGSYGQIYGDREQHRRRRDHVHLRPRGLTKRMHFHSRCRRLKRRRPCGETSPSGCVCLLSTRRRGLLPERPSLPDRSISPKESGTARLPILSSADRTGRHTRSFERAMTELRGRRPLFRDGIWKREIGILTGLPMANSQRRS